MKKVKLNILLVTLFILHGMSTLMGQTVVQLSPSVIASGGNYSSGTLSSLGTITLSSTVGECITTTVQPGTTPFTIKALTQGFQQPTNTSATLSINVLSANSSCISANNGSVMLNPVTYTGPVQYAWNGGAFGSTNLFQNLAPGTYYYQITDGTFSINDSVVITEAAVDCGAQLVFYTGITPNADGMNDTWVIDGITNFSESQVSIFSRWGDLVWSGDNYDNVNVVWDGKNRKTGKELPDATYFYVINAGGKTYKGWVELTH